MSLSAPSREESQLQGASNWSVFAGLETSKLLEDLYL